MRLRPSPPPPAVAAAPGAPDFAPDPAASTPAPGAPATPVPALRGRPTPAPVTAAPVTAAVLPAIPRPPRRRDRARPARRLAALCLTTLLAATPAAAERAASADAAGPAGPPAVSAPDPATPDPAAPDPAASSRAERPSTDPTPPRVDPSPPDPHWAERLQVVYDPVAQTVVRRRVRVEDLRPELGLAFLWEPAPGNWPGVDAEGRAEGPGRLAWRVPGAAGYDARALHHVYEGTLRAGRLHGAGRMRWRDGAWQEGSWRAGRLDGQGRAMSAEGDLHEGRFRVGLPHGPGLLRHRTGWVWEGGFAHGLRHGPGRLHPPGGRPHATLFEHGRELAADRPPLPPDPLVGGLLPAQTGSMAQRSWLSLTVDQRLTQLQDIPYTHIVRGEDIAVLPADAAHAALWQGGLPLERIRPFVLDALQGVDWRLHLRLDFGSTDGAPVTLAGVSLDVEYSVPHLQPMLQIDGHRGCTGFRPSFELRNFGWGPVEGGQLRVRFLHPSQLAVPQPDPRLVGPQDFTVPLPGFLEGIDVALREVIAQAGADVATLERQRFLCPGPDQLAACAGAVARQVNLGSLGPLAEMDRMGRVETGLRGAIDFTWRDAAGTVQYSSIPLAVRVSLLVIELDRAPAEQGEGGAPAPEAPDYVDIALPVSGQSYRYELPVRGNPTLRSGAFGAALWAEQSSFHRLRAVLRFADGSTRTSLPANLYLLQLRPSMFESRARPAVCTLPPWY